MKDIAIHNRTALSDMVNYGLFYTAQLVPNEAPEAADRIRPFSMQDSSILMNMKDTIQMINNRSDVLHSPSRSQALTSTSSVISETYQHLALSNLVFESIIENAKKIEKYAKDNSTPILTTNIQSSFDAHAQLVADVEKVAGLNPASADIADKVNKIRTSLPSFMNSIDAVNLELYKKAMNLELGENSFDVIKTLGERAHNDIFNRSDLNESIVEHDFGFQNNVNRIAQYSDIDKPLDALLKNISGYAHDSEVIHPYARALSKLSDEEKFEAIEKLAASMPLNTLKSKLLPYVLSHTLDEKGGELSKAYIEGVIRGGNAGGHTQADFQALSSRIMPANTPNITPLAEALLKATIRGDKIELANINVTPLSSLAGSRYGWKMLGADGMAMVHDAMYLNGINFNKIHNAGIEQLSSGYSEMLRQPATIDHINHHSTSTYRDTLNRILHEVSSEVGFIQNPNHSVDAIRPGVTRRHNLMEKSEIHDSSFMNENVFGDGYGHAPYGALANPLIDPGALSFGYSASTLASNYIAGNVGLPTLNPDLNDKINQAISNIASDPRNGRDHPLASTLHSYLKHSSNPTEDQYHALLHSSFGYLDGDQPNRIIMDAALNRNLSTEFVKELQKEVLNKATEHGDREPNEYAVRSMIEPMLIRSNEYSLEEKVGYAALAAKFLNEEYPSHAHKIEEPMTTMSKLVGEEKASSFAIDNHEKQSVKR